MKVTEFKGLYTNYDTHTLDLSYHNDCQNVKYDNGFCYSQDLVEPRTLDSTILWEGYVWLDEDNYNYDVTDRKARRCELIIYTNGNIEVEKHIYGTIDVENPTTKEKWVKVSNEEGMVRIWTASGDNKVIRNYNRTIYTKTKGSVETETPINGIKVVEWLKRYKSIPNTREVLIENIKNEDIPTNQLEDYIISYSLSSNAYLYKNNDPVSSVLAIFSNKVFLVNDNCLPNGMSMFIAEAIITNTTEKVVMIFLGIEVFPDQFFIKQIFLYTQDVNTNALMSNQINYSWISGVGIKEQKISGDFYSITIDSDEFVIPINIPLVPNDVSVLPAVVRLSFSHLMLQPILYTITPFDKTTADDKDYAYRAIVTAITTDGEYIVQDSGKRQFLYEKNYLLVTVLNSDHANDIVSNRVYLQIYDDTDKKKFIDYQMYADIKWVKPSIYEKERGYTTPLTLYLDKLSDTGIFFVQNTGYVYEGKDIEYPRLLKVDDYTISNGLGYMAFNGKIYRAIIGSGKIQNNNFYYQNAIPTVHPDYCKGVLFLGNDLGIVQDNRVELIKVDTIEDQFVYSYRGDFPYKVVDYINLGSESIFLSSHGIYYANSLQPVLLSENINDIIRRDYNKMSIGYSRIKNELYLLYSEEYTPIEP